MTISGRTYGEHAGAGTLPGTVRRRERVLALLRSADGPITAAELVEHLRRNRLRDYNYALALKDLNALAHYGLVRCVGHPKRWSA